MSIDLTSEPRGIGQDPEPAFADALRSAIDASGLALDRIHRRLGERGINLSSATLSYWQSGRSLPARRESLTALAELEKVLSVEPGQLAGLLPSPGLNRRRRTPLFRSAPTIRPDMDGPDLMAAFTVARRQFERISDHTVVTYGADRRMHGRCIHRIVRAREDGLDRTLMLEGGDLESVAMPKITPRSHCTVGRQHHFKVPGIVMYELLFDRVLSRNDLLMFEFDADFGPPYPVDTSLEYMNLEPMQEFVFELRFDPAAVPSRCEQFEYRIPGPFSSAPVHHLRPDSGNSILIRRQNMAPMHFVLRCIWD